MLLFTNNENISKTKHNLSIKLVESILQCINSDYNDF